MLEFKQMSKDLYENTYIPLPSKSLDIGEGDSIEKVTKKIDAFFDDIIRGYPDEVKELLNEMYYEDKNIIHQKNKTREQSAANWELRIYTDNSGFFYNMSVDSKVPKSPIIFRLYKIHEIAVHIGQSYQRALKIGLEEHIKECQNPKGFRLFTELSASIPEKCLIDAVPTNMFLRDLDNIFETKGKQIIKIKDKKAFIPPELHKKDNAYARFAVEDKIILQNKKMPFYNCMLLKHRPESEKLGSDVISDKVKLLLSRKDIKDFCEKFIYQEKAELLSKEEVQLLKKTNFICNPIQKP